MGREVVRTIAQARGVKLVAAVSRRGGGEDVGELAGIAPLGVPLGNDLAAALAEGGVNVLVDFTTPERVRPHIDMAIDAGVHAVIGTTGLTAEDVADIDERARRAGVGVLIAPNFALGAVLMIRFAREAARYLSHVEIIELHHNQKKDAPSGTARITAEMIEAQRAEAAAEDGAGAVAGVVAGLAGDDAPARGQQIGQVRVHSVRLPGLVAHQEVLFGGNGELLTLRHDSFSRTSFMAGVMLGIQRVSSIRGAVYGLEHILFPED